MSNRERLLREFDFPSIPDDWEVISLSQILSSERGISVGVMYPGKHDPKGIPLIRAGDLTGNRIENSPEFRISKSVNQEYKRTILEGGELLISLVGDIGRIAVVPEWAKGWNPARAIGVLRISPRAEAKYVRLVLGTGPLQKIMRAWANTTVQATLNLKEIKELPLPWPKKGVRDSIVDIADALENKIELNRQMNRTLELMARALFKSWFIDFDPVHAKQRGEQPAGMDAETAAFFPDRFEEIEGKEVPEGWEWKTVDQLYTLRGGSTPSTSNPEFWEGGTHSWTSPKDLSGLTTPFLTRTEKRITEAGTRVISSGILPEGTVLLSSRAPVGYLAIASMPVSINQGYIALESTGSLGRYFTLNLLQARLEEIKAMASGTTFPELSKKTFRTFAVLSPPRALCDAFEGAVSGLYEALLQNVHEIDQLASLRDSLLPRLLSGELDVSDWETAVEAAEGAPA